MSTGPRNPRNPYARLLRLRHLRPSAWQRESLTWGLLVLAVLLALAGLVSPWGIVVLPVLVTVLVKVQDVVTPRLAAAARAFAGGPSEAGRDGNDEPPATGAGGSGDEQKR